jgi:hypothetical protein
MKLHAMSRKFTPHHPYHAYHPYQLVNCAFTEGVMAYAKVRMVRII